ncbi:MAG: hypothetical protein MUC50_12220 [Myxococcota bacterium]|jgi:hypothetical protein|nr:hypothetical protein [Myxococcota bacterium]
MTVVDPMMIARLQNALDARATKKSREGLKYSVEKLPERDRRRLLELHRNSVRMEE